MLNKFSIIFISLFLASHLAVADEAADKEEFKRLNAEFNDLFANSAAIGPVIEVGERLYQLAEKTYGKDSQNMAVVTYNLASAYDEKGGDGKRSFSLQNSSEVKAINLYKLYFDRLEKLGTVYTRAHIDQYLKYITAYANHYNFRSNDLSSRTLLSIAQSMELPASELADLCITLGGLRTQAKHPEQSKYFYQTAYDTMKNAGELDQEQFGRAAHRLADFEYSSGNKDGAIPYYLDAISAFNSQDEKDIEALNVIYGTLSRLYVSMGNESDAKIYNDKLAELDVLSE